MNYKIDKIYDIYNYVKNEKCISDEELNNLKKNIFDIKGLYFNENKEVYFRYELFIENIITMIYDNEKTNKNIKIQRLEDRYNKYLDEYLDYIRNYNSDTIVFNFSGTGQIQSIQGNRPIKLTLEFLKKNIPTIYSFWTWSNKDYYLDKFEDGLLFQTPIHKTLENIETIIKYDFKNKHKIFILSFPYPNIVVYLDLFKEFNWKIIYDIRDDWEAFYKEKQAIWYDYDSEINSIKKAHRVMAVSYPLVEKFNKVCDNQINLLPNALDTSLNDKYDEINIKRKTSSNNKIGYVGNLTPSWFDWENMIYIATKLPKYVFEIVGNYDGIDTGNIPSNIKLLGPKQIEEVIKICNEWKVGIIPFKRSSISYGVDPIKVYEYLAMGLKVVSSDIPQIYSYPEVKIAKTGDEFVNFIKLSLVEDFNYKITAEFLSENTWECRANVILEMMKI